MTFRVVLTGGVASGKSVVANEFAALGVPVLDTDQISRDVQAPGTPTLEKIVAVFGKDILDAHGG
ncbi:MAG TPA: dephospho-CoA kinase, partial [Steroidobacteraceae bacterium]|nr:dephospho-CoA kinase [Steroidobacteraceae bacterium]